MPTNLRRLLLWTVVCVVSAAPSFAYAREAYDARAMVVGVGLFICIYTAISGTETFGRIYRRPFMRRTLYIGYSSRVLISILIPIGMAADVIPGIMSVGFVEKVLHIDTESFAGTFITTCVQGMLLNIILLIFMSLVQLTQRMFCKRPEQQQRGFEVIPMATRAEPLS